MLGLLGLNLRPNIVGKVLKELLKYKSIKRRTNSSQNTLQLWKKARRIIYNALVVYRLLFKIRNFLTYRAKTHRLKAQTHIEIPPTFYKSPHFHQLSFEKPKKKLRVWGFDTGFACKYYSPSNSPRRFPYRSKHPLIYPALPRCKSRSFDNPPRRCRCSRVDCKSIANRLL